LRFFSFPVHVFFDRNGENSTASCAGFGPLVWVIDVRYRLTEGFCTEQLDYFRGLREGE
jgi:hypothetical protein